MLFSSFLVSLFNISLYENGIDDLPDLEKYPKPLYCFIGKKLRLSTSDNGNASAQLNYADFNRVLKNLIFYLVETREIILKRSTMKPIDVILNLQSSGMLQLKCLYPLEIREVTMIKPIEILIIFSGIIDEDSSFITLLQKLGLNISKIQ